MTIPCDMHPDCEIKENGVHKIVLDKKPHKHAFVIPVEWTSTPNEYTRESLSITIVTKLKCSGCPEEKERT